jgi:hypothetical protein
MKPYHELLARPRLCVISGEPGGELDRLARIITPSVRVAGREDLEALLDHLLAAHGDPEPLAPKTLDLVGHSTGRSALLRLGDWVIDASRPEVAAWFRALAARDACPRLGIHAIRLLGCNTADTEQGRTTVCALADILGIEVHGTRHLLYDVHYDQDGFRDIWEFLLVSASRLRREATPAAIPTDTRSGPRTLDIEALPVLAPGPGATDWPRRVVTLNAARTILQLVQRDAGAPIPGLVLAPICELAIPSARTGGYHLAHVLLGGAFLRFFPDGAAAPGVAYPVNDARSLLEIIDQLPCAELAR